MVIVSAQGGQVTRHHVPWTVTATDSGELATKELGCTQSRG